MKFTRRPDLDPQTRIDIVKDVWLHQGIYGKMTQIAQEYHISRTFLYQLTWAARHHLEDLFSVPQHQVEPPDFLLEPWILALRLEGQCSIPSISSIFKHFDYQPNSVGYLSECLQDYGRCVPSTLSMPHQKVVFYLSDEIFGRFSIPSAWSGSMSTTPTGRAWSLARRRRGNRVQRLLAAHRRRQTPDCRWRRKTYPPQTFAWLRRHQNGRLPGTCDGSSAANAALDDLRWTGLPRAAAARILTVVDVGLRLPAPEESDTSRAATLDIIGLQRARQQLAPAVGHYDEFGRSQMAHPQHGSARRHFELRRSWAVRMQINHLGVTSLALG